MKNLTMCLSLVLVLFGSSYAMDPPMAHWPLDESDGETAEDIAGEWDGTWVGNIGWFPEAGRFGGAIECNDDSSFIEIPDPDSVFFDVLGTEFTVSVWVQPYEYTQDWQGIVFKNNKFFLERNSSGSGGTVDGIHFKCKDENGSQPFNLYGNIILDPGYWHHVVGIYDFDMAYLYINGELDVEGEATGDFIGAIPDPLLIGAKMENTYRNSWNGLIDDVKFFNYPLTMEQVDSLFQMEAAVHSKRGNGLVKIMKLHPNYPNPFNPSTSISYDLAAPGQVELAVYSTQGQLVKTLVSEEQSAGAYKVTYTATDDRGNPLSSGVYFYSLRVKTQRSEFTDVGRMVLLK